MTDEQKKLGIIFDMDIHMNLMSIHAKNNVHGYNENHCHLFILVK